MVKAQCVGAALGAREGETLVQCAQRYVYTYGPRADAIISEATVASLTSEEPRAEHVQVLARHALMLQRLNAALLIADAARRHPGDNTAIGRAAQQAADLLFAQLELPL